MTNKAADFLKLISMSAMQWSFYVCIVIFFGSSMLCFSALMNFESNNDDDDDVLFISIYRILFYNRFSPASVQRVQILALYF
jgi:hypothetical protein